MTLNENKNESKQIILENLDKNIDLYNKYTLLLSTIFISALTAIGKTTVFTYSLKTSIFLFSIALASTLTELSLLIIHDSLLLEVMQCNIIKKISIPTLLLLSERLAILSLIAFLLGIFSVNILVFMI